MESPNSILKEWNEKKRELKKKYLQDLDEFNKFYSNLLGRALGTIK